MFINQSLEERIEKAKNNEEELNELIEEYKPFIVSSVHKKTRKFLQYGYDDELTIGMMAFKEAVEAYDSSKGRFLSFAQQVITLRIIDYYRKDQRHKEKEYLYGIHEEYNEVTNHAAVGKAIEQYNEQKENEMRKLEISEYKKELKNWGIEFSDLVQASPKQEKLRRLYKEVARFIVQEKDTLQELMNTKRLPIKEIEKNILIHRKKIERGRIYIIALVVALLGDYELIWEYID